ncbi:RLA class II histocompatibility antigen, DP alpha-1 chain-like [Choloepus didactylus]|uniref:RLA class II histocompatibility antigen, DP alpha-1 chain-like n=1 Tax=Choloepus didactylus TaxID=27675 RepID=UPI0018A02441|nr:RLA class II histocompatibility antigen, DP alpha-1 chain-like [Choloepus didactylus]
MHLEEMRSQTRALILRALTLAALLSPRGAGAPKEPPEVTVFPKEPVELGQPNTLICHLDKFFPPVLNVTWLRNGQPVTKGVGESLFLPSTEFRFHKFHYLTFLPTAENVYDCQVEHCGLDGLLLQHWEAQEPIQVPETMETVVCALGLAVGLVGIIAGTVVVCPGCISGFTGSCESSRGGKGTQGEAIHLFKVTQLESC